MSIVKTGFISPITLGRLIPQKSVRESYEKALGALVMRFCLLHFLLEDFSHEVFAISEQTASTLLNDLPVTRLIEKLRACAKYRMPRENDRKEFLLILNRAARAAEQRNEFLHALWIINEGQPVFCQKRRGNQAQSQAPSIGEINALGSSILQLTGDLMNLIERQPLASPSELALAPSQENQPNP